ncbi:hypothetical protein [Streptomyces diastatochromogenes]
MSETPPRSVPPAGAESCPGIQSALARVTASLVAGVDLDRLCPLVRELLG